MVGKTERVTFRCAPSGAALVRAWAEVEDVPVSTAWRRVMRAGIGVLGLQGKVGEVPVAEQLRQRVADIEKAPTNPRVRIPATVWTGAVDADGYPMPEEGQ